jgi:hypothetical protein
VTPFYSSNILQFDPFFSSFTSRGAILYAKLAEANGIYRIVLFQREPKRRRTSFGAALHNPRSRIAVPIRHFI